MSDHNGHNWTDRHTSPASLPLSPRRRQPSFADMSSQQRSASMDNIVRQVEALTQQVTSLTMQQGATFNSLAEFCGRTFWQRLRWLVTGR